MSLPAGFARLWTAGAGAMFAQLLHVTVNAPRAATLCLLAVAVTPCCPCSARGRPWPTPSRPASWPCERPHRANPVARQRIRTVHIGAGCRARRLWVLDGTERLGLTATGYGLFVAAGAVGGVTGSWVYGRLEIRFGMVTLLRAGLVIGTLTYAALALTRNPWLAGLTMAVFGVHAIVWGTVATTVRQRATPSGLLGRVGSVYQLASVGGAAVGERFGLLAPFWVAFAAVGAITAWSWRGLRSVEVSRSAA